MQCEWSECESPETSLMRFGAMHIISLSIMGSKKIQLVFTKKIKETPGNRLIKTHRITVGSIWNTDCTCA